jgi:hypothetical protein
MSAGKTKIASGVDGVGITVAVGMGVCVGTAVGGAISVGSSPHEVNKARARITKKKNLIRTGLLQHYFKSISKQVYKEIRIHVYLRGICAHSKHIRNGFESLQTFEAKSGDFAIRGDNLCLHTGISTFPQV